MPSCSSVALKESAPLATSVPSSTCNKLFRNDVIGNFRDGVPHAATHRPSSTTTTAPEPIESTIAPMRRRLSLDQRDPAARLSHFDPGNTGWASTAPATPIQNSTAHRPNDISSFLMAWWRLGVRWCVHRYYEAPSSRCGWLTRKACVHTTINE